MASTWSPLAATNLKIPPVADPVASVTVVVNVAV
jgi:hypothetical protein